MAGWLQNHRIFGQCFLNQEPVCVASKYGSFRAGQEVGKRNQNFTRPIIGQKSLSDLTLKLVSFQFLCASGVIGKMQKRMYLRHLVSKNRRTKRVVANFSQKNRKALQ